MKTKFTYCVLVAMLVVVAPSVKSQDFHLSQYDMAPLYMNPALAGQYMGEKGDFRMMANYRSQWQKLQSKPYSTSAFAFDRPIGRFGAGIFLMDNLAGRSNLNTFNCMIGGSYQITSQESKTHYLITGIQVGVVNKKFGDNDLLFTSQYNSNSGLDAALDNGENFQKFSKLNFDSNLGMFYKYRSVTNTINPFIGFSIYHVNKPNQAVNGQKSKMPMRFNMNLGVDYHINESLYFQPMLLYMYQGKAHELDMGMLAYFRMQGTQYDLIAGLSYRVKDAVVLNAGIKQAQSTFRISYDIVTNHSLKVYSGKRGGMELGVIYTGFSKEKKVVQWQ